MFSPSRRASKFLAAILAAWFGLLSAGVHALHTDGDSPERRTQGADRATSSLSLGADSHGTCLPDDCPACQYLRTVQSNNGFLRNEAPAQPLSQRLFLIAYSHLRGVELSPSAPPRGPPCSVLA